MKTDKNTLFKAMGDIDDRFIVEVLDEDAAGVVHAKSAGQKKTAVIRFVRYALPSAAALLIAFVCVRSLHMTGGMQESATTSNYSAAEAPSAGSMADAAKESEVDYMMECAEAEPDREAYSFDLNGIVSSESTSAAPSNAEGAASSDDLGMQDSSSSDNLEANMVNPFIECDTLSEAAEIAGFEFDIPQQVTEGYEVLINAINGQLIQVICYEPGGDEIFRLRKGRGDDISGDFNEYGIVTDLGSDMYTGSLMGNKPGRIMKAVWNDAEFAYSLTAGDASLDEDLVREIINAIM